MKLTATYTLELTQFEFETLAILVGRVTGVGERKEFCEKFYNHAEALLSEIGSDELNGAVSWSDGDD